MRWWRERGRSIALIVMLLLVFNDPVDRLLPVPMPALQPGPDTTWAPDLEWRDGEPRFEPGIDRILHSRSGMSGPAVDLAAVADVPVEGLPLWQFIETQWLGTDPDRDVLPGFHTWLLEPLRAAPRDPAAAGQWRQACRIASDRIAAIPDDAAPAPTGEVRQQRRFSLDGLMRDPAGLIMIVHAAAAEQERALSEPDRLPLAHRRLLVLATHAERLGDLASCAAAASIRGQARMMLLRAIAADPVDHDTLRLAEELNALPIRESRNLASALRVGRLLNLRTLCGFHSEALRRPGILHDVNEALRTANAWWDMVDSEMAGEDDPARVLSWKILERLRDAAQDPETDAIPLANQMVFTITPSQILTGNGRALGRMCASWSWQSLAMVKNWPIFEERCHVAITAISNRPPRSGEAAAAYAEELRQELPKTIAVSAEAEAGAIPGIARPPSVIRSRRRDGVILRIDPDLPPILIRLSPP